MADSTPRTAFSARDLAQLTRTYPGLAPHADEIAVTAAVLPFRVTTHVLELIRWEDVPDRDPIFALSFPRREMLDPDEFHELESVRHDAGRFEAVARRIRERRERAGQSEIPYVPKLHGRPLRGLQRKYETSLTVFPAASETSRAFGGYGFRAGQFVDAAAGVFELSDPVVLRDYLTAHPEIEDVIYAGLDPLLSAARVLRRFVEPVLESDGVRSVRFGTALPAYWPGRFLDEPDAEELLGIFAEVASRNKSVSIMFSSSHPRELEAASAREAIAVIRRTGAEIRTQTAIMRGVNDDAATLRALWNEQLRLACVPYDVFLPRDTGAHRIFDVSIAHAVRILAEAARDLPSIAPPARGPVMSTKYGKIAVAGALEIAGRKAFVLRFARATAREDTGRLFLAAYDEAASAFGDLRPFGPEPFPFVEDGWKV